MSYFTTPEVVARLRIGLSKDDGNKPRLGCSEPTAEYGETPGVERFEVGLANGDIEEFPEAEWPERLEALERRPSTLFDRIDADWERALTQGRCGYCWYYAVVAAAMASMARDGLKAVHLSAAHGACRVKNGRDEGGWPTDAAADFMKHGVPTVAEHPDCSCSGRSCAGPRSGCRARDMSLIPKLVESSKRTTLKFYELPRDRSAIEKACILATLNNLAYAGGWVGTGAWADGHAMGVLHTMRDRRRGWLPVPENSWGMFKRRIPVERFPRGGVVVVRAHRRAG